MSRQTISDDLSYSSSASVELPPEPPPYAGDMRGPERIPHIGHALLFLAFAWLVAQFVFLLTGHIAHIGPGTPLPPKLQLTAMAIIYFLTLAACLLAFPLFWGRSFLAGIEWHGDKVLRLSARLISLGLSVGWMVQAISSLIPVPKSMPMDNFFRNSSDIWLVAAFGTLIAPLFEEITFRGFLLPALSIALDWLGSLLRYVRDFSIARVAGREPSREIVFFREDAAAEPAGQSGNLLYRSRTAVVLSSLLTSALFARIHADQLAHAAGALYILFCVSLILTLIRVQTRSVACSTLVHASYNLSVFITIFVGTSGFRHLDKLGH